jgi:hypothetical protein
MELSDSIEITASAAAAFEVVSHLEDMGRFSPENTGGEWRGGGGPALGARFKGTNQRGEDDEIRHWSTTATVTAYDPPHRFAFRVSFGPFKVSTWTYEIEPTATGIVLTERWVDERGRLLRWDAARGGADDREEFTAVSLRTTLEAIKALLEGGDQPGS